VAIVAALLRGPGAAGVFFIAAAGYFLLYETLHALYHLPEATLERLGLRGNGVFDRLQSHHRHHHRLSRMAKVNFNVTFPMADWAFGTMEKEAADADGEAAAEQIGA
jgi:sterol desaturase/sphingolipid hydroxylase (fatty acid hydroxylase superfamily)